MIQISSLYSGYRDDEILHGIDLVCETGTVTTLIGRNGCGKTTLLKTLTGIIPLKKGNITIEGADIGSLTKRELAKRIAYLSQGKNVPDITVGRLVLHGRFPYLSYPRKYRKNDFAAALDAMEKMGISHLKDRQMSTLSGGMRQKAYISMALAQQSAVIIMDEPTTYLDAGQQIKFAASAKSLAKSGKTVLLVLHDIPLALKVSDKIAVMNSGRITMCGTPQEILKSGYINDLYDIDIGIAENCLGKQYYYNIDIEK